MKNDFDDLLQEIESVAITDSQRKERLWRHGEYFSLLDILGLGSDEVKHSAIIASLLNPKGSHGMGDVFLKSFLRIVDLPEHFIDAENFNDNSIVERSIDFKNADETEGGRLDIIIEDYVHAIIIENKLDANDQSHQLLRYNNYGRRTFHKGCYKLLYLTKDGHNPSSFSTGDENLEYKCISYSKEILDWLKQCAELSKGKSRVHDSIRQYIQSVREVVGGEEPCAYPQIMKLIKDYGLSHSIEEQVLQRELSDTILEKYFVDPLRNFALDHNLKFVNKEGTTVYEFDIRGWDGGILIFNDTNKGWHNHYVGVSFPEKKTEHEQFNCLREKANNWWPYGFEYIPKKDLDDPYAYPYLINGDAESWTERKITSILKELDRRGIIDTKANL